jgi:hypothetical protein
MTAFIVGNLILVATVAAGGGWAIRKERRLRAAAGLDPKPKRRWRRARDHR